MEEDKIPASLKLKLMEAEKQVNETMPKGPNWRRGLQTAILTGIAFLAVGIAAKAPILSSLGFAFVGAITGLMVGAYRKIADNGKQ